MNLRKGQLLIKNLVEEWMLSTGENPSDHDIVTHILSIDDKEYDAYMNNKSYIDRQMLIDEAIQKQNEDEANKPNTKKHRTQVS